MAPQGPERPPLPLGSCPSATQVKICGITRLQDAELAVELGAWAVGMVFFDASPRACSLAEGQRIATSLRRKVELCGVFVNAQMEEIVGVSEQLGLTLLQLHGDEGPVLLRGGRPPHRGAHSQGAAGVRLGRHPGRVPLPHRFPFARCTLDRAWTRAVARRHGGDVRLGAAGRPALESAADPQRRPESRQRGRGDRACASVRGRHRQWHRECAWDQGPGEAARLLRRCGSCRLRFARRAAVPVRARSGPGRAARARRRRRL